MEIWPDDGIVRKGIGSPKLLQLNFEDNMNVCSKIKKKKILIVSLN